MRSRGKRDAGVRGTWCVALSLLCRNRPPVPSGKLRPSPRYSWSGRAPSSRRYHITLKRDDAPRKLASNFPNCFHPAAPCCGSGSERTMRLLDVQISITVIANLPISVSLIICCGRICLISTELDRHPSVIPNNPVKLLPLIKNNC